MSSELVCCFKISSSALFFRRGTDELPVIWTGKDGMDDRERKLSFCDIFTEALVVCVLCVLKILIIVSDLEQNSNQVDKGDIVTTFSNYREWRTNMLLGLHVCMSLTARRRRPPVLLLTISTYSSSVGQVRLSRQKRSIPCPR